MTRHGSVLPGWKLMPGRKRKVREALIMFTEYGILEVVTPHRDPLKAEYRMPDPEGVDRALRELGY